MGLAAPPRLRWLARFAAPILVGLVGAWIGTAAFARSTVPMGPFRVQLEAGLGRPGTDIGLPPLGQLHAATHDLPLRLSATLRDVDVQGLQAYLRTHSLDQLASDVEQQALDRLLPFAIRTLAVGLAGALALALLAYRRRLRPILGALLATALVLGGTAAVTARTYDSSAFLRPRYSGTLSLAPQLFGPIETTVQRFDYFRTELQRIVAAGAGAYAAVQQNQLGRGNEIRVLHISDIHDSPLGYRFAQELASGFDVNFVIDTGDITSFGTPAENLILKYVPGFDRPYVFVRGSHDSHDLQAQMARIPNARVLDGGTTTIDGLTIYGLGDPYFVERRGNPLTDQQVANLVAGAGPRLARDVGALARPPDIVAVHDDRMAEAAAGAVPLVLSGHFHENAARVENGTLFLRVGTTGGAGPTGGVAIGGQVPLSAEILYFRPASGGKPPRLIAWDTVEQMPTTGDFTVERHVVAETFGAVSPAPSGSPAASSGPGKT